jgi:hypothetical protein
MILFRITFHAKFGKAGEVVALMKEGRQAAAEQGGTFRIMTDLTGRFDTVVLEVEAESMTEHEQRRAAMFANPHFQQNQSRMAELIDWGESAFYTIEA